MHERENVPLPTNVRKVLDNATGIGTKLCVTRTIIIYGEVDWVENVLARSFAPGIGIGGVYAPNGGVQCADLKAERVV